MQALHLTLYTLCVLCIFFNSHCEKLSKYFFFKPRCNLRQSSQMISYIWLFITLLLFRNDGQSCLKLIKEINNFNQIFPLCSPVSASIFIGMAPQILFNRIINDCAAPNVCKWHVSQLQSWTIIWCIASNIVTGKLWRDIDCPVCPMLRMAIKDE